MKTFRKISLFCGAVIASAAMVLNAAQPVVWTANITNSIPNATAATTPVTTSLGNVVWTSGGAVSSNYVDTLQGSTATVYANAFTVGNAAGPVAATYTFSTLYSPDAVTWVAGTNVAVSVTATNANNGAWQKIDTSTFRYFAITNVVCTVTNAYTTNTANGGLTFKVLLKGP